MTGRERLARAAAWFVPAPERSEPVHTALDVAGGSITRFVRELAGLAWYGYRRRGADVAGISLGRVLADGLAQGAVWVVVFELADLVAHISLGHRGPLESLTATVLLAVALALALVGLDRLAGLAGLGWLVVWTPILAQYRTPAGLTALLVPLLGFAVLLAAPRRRALDARRLLWFAVPAAIASTAGPGPNPVGFLIWLPIVLIVVAAAVLMLPTDPRLAIAAALPITYIGSQKAVRGDAGSIVLTSAVLLALALAVLLRRLRHPQSGTPAI
jgi:hypothetical protein